MSSLILFPTNQYTTSSKSSQQIQKLMIPQQSPQQTLLYILNKEHPLQLPYVYKNFHKYYKNLLNLVCQKLDKEEAENQIIITQSIKTLLKKNNTILQNQEIQKIFNSTLTALKNWNTINNQHLVQVIEITLEKQQTRTNIVKEIEKTILDMGKPTQPIISKVIAGRLVAIIVKYMGRSIKGQMIDIIKKIITSSQAEAKKIWINQIFPKLLQNLDIEFIQLHLQQKIYQTIYDENQQIGLMALQIILRNATKFSIEEQGSRIVKLFIDSMTSKNQKIVLMTTSFMGQTYRKLQSIILKSQTNCIRFWRSLIEVPQAKNQKIINNFIYNLPGILYLSKKFFRVDPLCDVYIELFFHPDSDTILLVSYFHQMVKMFPSKHKLLKQTIYNLLNQVFQDNQPSDQSLKIVDCLLIHLKQSKQAFFDEIQKYEQRQNNINQNKFVYFDNTFNQYLHKYFTYCFQKKNGNYLVNFYQAIKKCHQYFSPGFTQVTLLPRLYSFIRSKTAYLELVIQIFIMFLARQVSSNTLINNYASKFNVELSKSSKSHQRQSSMLFFYYASFYFSIQTFQEFKMGEKFLQFNNEKNLKNKLLFIKYLPRLGYFFTRQQKIQYQIILNRLRKDPDSEIIRMIEKTDFTENQNKKLQIMNKSKIIKEKQKTRGSINCKKALLPNKRQTKELKKEDILRKRVDTRSRPKIIIKQIPKRKTPMSIARVNRKNI